MERERVETCPRQSKSQPSEAGSKDSPESGMVTVELALGFGAVAIVVLALMLALVAGSTHAHACHAARTAARAHCLGEDSAGAAAQVSPRPVSVSISGSSGWFSATATSPALSFGGWNTLPIRCEVTAYREPHLAWGGS